MNNRTLTKVKKALETVTNVTDIRKDGKYVEVSVSPTVFERDSSLYVSAEDGYGFADAYGEFRGGYQWIDPRLVDIAKANGCYWEWVNAGCIVLAD